MSNSNVPIKCYRYLSEQYRFFAVNFQLGKNITFIVDQLKA